MKKKYSILNGLKETIICKDSLFSHFIHRFFESSDIKFLNELLELIQNLCENCNLKFQLLLTDNCENACCNFL